jgi:hypothetical protein
MARALSDYPELARYMDGPGRDPKDAEPARQMRREVSTDLTWTLARCIDRLYRPRLRHGPEVEAER